MFDTHLSRWYEKLTGKPADHTNFFGCHKTFLVIIAIFICLYALLVVLQGQGVPEIGIRSAFSTEIIRLRDSHFRPAKGAFPKVGDEIVQFGDKQIHVWPQWLNAIGKLKEADAVEVKHLPAGESGKSHVKLGDEELVLVGYR